MIKDDMKYPTIRPEWKDSDYSYIDESIFTVQLIKIQNLDTKLRMKFRFQKDILGDQEVENITYETYETDEMNELFPHNLMVKRICDNIHLLDDCRLDFIISGYDIIRMEIEQSMNGWFCKVSIPIKQIE